MPAPMPDQITEKLDADKPPNKAAFAGCARLSRRSCTKSESGWQPLNQRSWMRMLRAHRATQKPRAPRERGAERGAVVDASTLVRRWLSSRHGHRPRRPRLRRRCRWGAGTAADAFALTVARPRPDLFIGRGSVRFHRRSSRYATRLGKHDDAGPLPKGANRAGT